MNRKISLGAAVSLLLIVAALVFSVTMNYATGLFNQRVSDLTARETMYDKFAEIDGQVRQNYNGPISETQLMDSVAGGYISGIGDKYGRYISAEEYKKMTRESESENEGIGAVIEVAPDDFYLVVVEVYPDSPAEVAGIQAGDLIVKIDDTDLSRENSRQMLESIPGPAGSKITLVTRRGSAESTSEMTRRAVALPTVTDTRLLGESAVGYLRIKEFGDRTYDQFNRELLRLMDTGATSLVVDLRDAKSDALRSCTRILDKLLPEGVLASAIYKNGRTEVLYTSDANAIDLPVVVLTNAATTGTPELFAQAIQDFGKGRTVGATTAGKGTMQRLVRLEDGSALELSVATYVSKSGLSWQGTGVKADFEVAQEGDWTVLPEEMDSQLVKAKEVAIGLTPAAEVPETSEAAPESSGADGESAPTAELEATPSIEAP